MSALRRRRRSKERSPWRPQGNTVLQMATEVKLISSKFTLINEKTEIKKSTSRKILLSEHKVVKADDIRGLCAPTHPWIRKEQQNHHQCFDERWKQLPWMKTCWYFFRVAVDGGHILLLLRVSNTVRMVGYTKPTQHKNWIEINDSLTSWKGQQWR